MYFQRRWNSIEYSLPAKNKIPKPRRVDMGGGREQKDAGNVGEVDYDDRFRIFIFQIENKKTAG